MVELLETLGYGAKTSRVRIAATKKLFINQAANGYLFRISSEKRGLGSPFHKLYICCPPSRSTLCNLRKAGPLSAVGSATDSSTRYPGFNARFGHILSFPLPLIQAGQCPLLV